MGVFCTGGEGKGGVYIVGWGGQREGRQMCMIKEMTSGR